MLSHTNLPNSFWAEALNHDMYVLNLSPSVPLAGDIPQRVWSGKEVSYKHLKVFGCKAFVHVDCVLTRDFLLYDDFEIPGNGARK